MRRKKKASPTDPGKSLLTVWMGTEVVFPDLGKISRIEWSPELAQ